MQTAGRLDRQQVFARFGHDRFWPGISGSPPYHRTSSDTGVTALSSEVVRADIVGPLSRGLRFYEYEIRFDVFGSKSLEGRSVRAVVMRFGAMSVVRLPFSYHISL